MNDDAKDGLYKKQTAVDRLIQILINRGFIAFPYTLPQSTLWNVVDEAKAMEKEQIKNSYHSGTIDGFNFRTTSISPNPEEYYNETFKSE